MRIKDEGDIQFAMNNQSYPYRRQEILKRLLIDGAVSVDALSKALGVSLPTVRRDLGKLEDEGVVRRTHGGATVEAPRGADQEFAVREQTDAAEKKAIAQSAVDMVAQDATLLMNDGSTVLGIARELVARNLKVTVITPGVNIATLLSESPRINTYLLGGVLRHRSLGTSGTFAEQMLNQFNADLAFIAAESFSAEAGLSYSYEADAMIARLMSERARTTVVVANARKLGGHDRITALPATSINTLITGCLNPDVLQPFRVLGIDVVIAGHLTESS